MDCCQCQGIEDLFNEKNAARELEEYRKKGPSQTTRVLVEAIRAEGVEGATLLDIGGGVGAVQHALLRAGVQSATDVDASRAYLNAARQEAARRGMAEQVQFQHGNFVELAGQAPAADIVTLDRVICCYHDMERLVRLSVGRAKRLYGVVYPRDAWWVRLGIRILNLFFRVQKTPFRTFVHPTESVEALIAGSGFKRKFHRKMGVWQVAVFARQDEALQLALN